MKEEDGFTEIQVGRGEDFFIFDFGFFRVVRSFFYELILFKVLRIFGVYCISWFSYFCYQFFFVEQGVLF